MAKRKYRVLLALHLDCDFDVMANSYEEACKMLKKELRTRKGRYAQFSQIVETNWSDPAKYGQAWLITRATDDIENAAPPIMMWDGKKIVDSGLTPFPGPCQAPKEKSHG